MNLAESVENPAFPAILATDNSAETIQSVREGATERFYDLIRPHERNVYLTALAITGSHADAEEVVQESVMKAFVHLDQFRGESKFSTWLVRITVNEARGLLRRQRRVVFEPLERELPSGRTVQRDFPDWRESQAQSLEREEVNAVVSRAVKQLPPKYRDIFMMRDLQKLSIAETARRLRITRSTVKARLWRARLKMRRLVSGRLTYVPGRRKFSVSQAQSEL